MSVTKRTRYEVLRRDNFTCRYCGASAPDVKLTVDHVTAVTLGGTDKPDNLVVACEDCNSGKSSTTTDASLVKDVKTTDLKWAAALSRAADILQAQRDREVAYVQQWTEYWRTYLWGRWPDQAEESVVRLYRAGLPIAEVEDAVLITATVYGVQDRFRYFMGVCWNKVSDMQEIAKELLEAEGDET